MSNEYDELTLAANAQAFLADHPQVHLVQNNIVLHNLDIIRDRKTRPHKFSNAIATISESLLLAASTELTPTPHEITTPNAKMDAYCLRDTIALAVIMRAGLGMLDPWRDKFRKATILHVAMHRDEHTTEPIWDRPLCKSKKIARAASPVIFVLDVMHATGGSAIATCTKLKQQYPHAKLVHAGIIAAPEGLKAFTEAHPSIPVYMAAIDDHLNNKAYIVPGLGDAGDRQFGTT